MQSELRQPAVVELSLSCVMALALSVGIATGIGEALEYLTLWHFGVPQLLWVTPLFDAVLFALIGLALWMVSRALRRFSADWPIFLFAWAAFYDWSRVIVVSSKWRYVALVVSCLAARIVASWSGRAMRLRAKPLWKVTCALATTLLICGIGLGAYLSIQEQRSIERLRPAAGSPNILLIIVDTLRADHLPTYGYSRPTAPYLDQLAKQGVVFDNAIATSSWTLPSHASMLSGWYPHEHGAENDGLSIRATAPLVPAVFSERGYRTGAFSANGYFFCRRFGFGRGFAHFEDDYPSAETLVWSTFYGRRLQTLATELRLTRILFGRKSAEEINRATLNWIGESDDKPFFVVLNYFDVHPPYMPPEPFRSRFMRPGARITRNQLNKTRFLPAQQRQNEIDAYDSAIAYVDSQIHDLLAELQSRQFLKNTIVVVTSDHGEEFEEHGFYFHGNALYRELVRVPLIIWAEHSVPRGEHISQATSLVHLPATLLKLATGKADVKFPQASLSELWSKPSPAEWPAPMSELAQRGGSSVYLSFGQGFRSITTNEWHFIKGDKWGEELYRCCSNDIERDNLARQAAFRSVCDRLKAQLESAPAPMNESRSARKIVGDSPAQPINGRESHRAQ